MRKAISTVLATALLLAGLWLCWLFFTPGGSGRLPNIAVRTRPIPGRPGWRVAVGGLAQSVT
jgi:hypothetical protein